VVIQPAFDFKKSGAVPYFLFPYHLVDTLGHNERYTPQISCEFGCQAMLLKIKPSFLELETALRDINTRWRRRNRKDHEGELDAEVDNLWSRWAKYPEGIQ
jgi:hypothetical protein